MIWTIAFAILLYLVCAALLVAEVFVPSGGLLTVAAIGCLAGGVALFFQLSLTAGWVGVVIAIILIPCVLITTYRIFPKTRFGRAITLNAPQRERGDAIPDGSDLAELQGQTGHVVTPLRPVGSCDFSGRKVECVAQNGYVDVGQTVTVVRIEGTQVTVRVQGETTS